MEGDFSLEDILDSYKLDRLILHSVDLPESLDPENPLSNLDSHVTVVKKINGDWYLFDLARKEPLKLAGNEEVINHWLSYFDYVNVWSFKGMKLSSKRSKPLLKQWNRVMAGLPAEEIGGNHKKPSSQRALSKKSDRNDGERTQTGTGGKRKTASTEIHKKKVLSGNKLAKPLGNNVPEKIVKDIKDDRTKAAGKKRHASTTSIGDFMLEEKPLNIKRVK
jgi:hypothetical protein